MARVWRAAVSLVLAAAILLFCSADVAAAEVLQVRSGSLLQVGDHNRTYSVEVGCLRIPPDNNEAATAWLRQALPRRTRVNLRPLGNHDGTLQARVQRLANGDAPVLDLGEGLIAAGLAEPLTDCPS